MKRTVHPAFAGTLRKLAWSATGLLSVATAQAAEPTWGVGLGVVESNNITRDDANKSSETIGSVTFTVNLDSDRPRLDTTLRGGVSYLNYLHNTYSDEVTGGLSGSLGLLLWQDHLTWMAEDNFGQVKRQPPAGQQPTVTVDTPENREQFNFFSTGPEFRFDLGDRSRLNFGGRWADTHYQYTHQADTRRYSAHSSFVETFSREFSASLNASGERVKFTEDQPAAPIAGPVVNPDYDLREYSLGLAAKTTRRTTATLEVGRSTVKHEDSSSSGLLLRGSLTTNVSPSSALRLSAGSQYSDAAQTFRLEQAQVNPQNTTPMIVAQDAFKSDYAYAGWDLGRPRTSLALGLSWRRETHDRIPANDVSYSGVRGGVTRRMTPRTELDFTGSYDLQKFRVSGAEGKSWAAGLGLGWSMTEALRLVARVDHAVGTGGGAALFEYHETRASLTLRYAGAVKK